MEPKHFESLYPENVRFAEIDKIFGYIKEGSSCQLVGLSGVGRTNILAFLAYNKEVKAKHIGDQEKWVHFVPVNFSEIRNRPLIDVTKFLFLSLVDSLRERGMQEEYHALNDIFRESLSLGDELVLFQGLKRGIDLLAIEKKMTVVFLFDRFEEYLTSLTSDFFANLRILRDRAKYRFSVVFSLTRPLEELLEPALLSDFYDFVADHVVYVQLYDEVGSAFRLSYLEKLTGKTIGKSTLDELIRLSGGHLRLLRTSAEAVLAHEDHGNEIEAFLLSQRSIQAVLKNIFFSLAPSEQKWLTENVHQAEETVPEYLENVGLTKNGEIQIPLLATFLKTEGKDEVAVKDQIIFDEATNTIRHGDTVISERLTAAEYRLLKYCLDNSGKVLDREDVITAVWQGTQSLAGVSDQALDQLVSRLRRKVEDNPNSPTHLQTVKGRGFQFNS